MSRKKKEKAPAANPPQNDVQLHGEDAGTIAAEVEDRGTASKYAKQHAGQPSVADREVEDELA